MGKIPDDCLVCLRIAWESYGVCECPCWGCMQEDKIAMVMREYGLGFPEAVEWLGKAIGTNGKGVGDGDA